MRELATEKPGPSPRRGGGGVGAEVPPGCCRTVSPCGGTDAGVGPPQFHLRGSLKPQSRGASRQGTGQGGAHCRWWLCSGGRPRGKSRVPAARSALHPLPPPQLPLSSLTSLTLGISASFLLLLFPNPSPSEGPDGPKLPRELERGGRLRRWAAAPARPRAPPAGIPARAAEWLRGRRPGEEGGWAGLSAARGLGAAAQ